MTSIKYDYRVTKTELILPKYQVMNIKISYFKGIFALSLFSI